MPGEKATAYYDEDSITMAVGAAIDCLRDTDNHTVDGLYFATTTSPYKEKQCSSIMAMPLDLRRDIKAVDITNSLRSGTIAIDMALDAIKASTAKSILVTASDARMAAPSSRMEAVLGDGAGAILLGSENVIAEIQESYSISDELAATWRGSDDTFVRSWEERMVLDEGYAKIMPEVIAGLMSKCSMSPSDFTRVVLDPPVDVRRHAKVAGQIGFDPGQLLDPSGLFMMAGHLGSAMSLTMLVAALESAKPGDKILWASYGNGADAFVLEVTDAIGKLGERRGLKSHIESKHVIDNYVTYLRWRELVPQDEADRPERAHISVAANTRSRRQILGLWGVKCRQCGTPQYDGGTIGSVPIRVCAVCQARDDFEDYGFADRKATIFSFTHDNLAPSPDKPSSVAVVDFEGGGRFLFDLTDSDPAEVNVGMEVEMTFRKIWSDRGISNYHWKARPIRC